MCVHLMAAVGTGLILENYVGVHPGVSTSSFHGEGGHGRMVPSESIKPALSTVTSAGASSGLDHAGSQNTRVSGGIASEHNDKCDSHVT